MMTSASDQDAENQPRKSRYVADGKFFQDWKINAQIFVLYILQMLQLIIYTSPNRMGQAVYIGIPAAMLSHQTTA